MESGNDSTIRDMTSLNISVNDTFININRYIQKEELTPILKKSKEFLKIIYSH